MQLAYKTVRGAAWGERASQIVIAHGLLGSSSNWLTVARRLAEHELLRCRLHEIHMLDMRNHGDSPHVCSHTNAALSSDIERFTLQQQREHKKFCTRGVQEGNMVWIGHSMGGFAVMGALLRRANEVALLKSTLEELQGRCERGDFYGWHDSQGYAKEMRDVSAEFGLSEEEPLSSRLFFDDDRGATCDFCPTVKAAIIVDIAPSTSIMHRQGNDVSPLEMLEAMKAVNLTEVHSSTDAENELKNAGVVDKFMRSFLLTNLRFKSKGCGAEWRVNLPVIHSHYSLISLGLLDWYIAAERQGASCAGAAAINKVAPQRSQLPVLFVFGEKSPYNNPAHVQLIDLFFSNVTRVEIPAAGHFVHYDKMYEFIDAVVPFLADHL
ncbi:putative Serine aminopeptidase S33 putatively [Trypanosoma vivax]|uniref:AB hydrolase-1 domain-containing protein n=1 Tax=Trypanosoma vivax (strain Y486) TaxID=1055687 RepID=G0UAR8_TRYVY|nr:hypothetical protein TRVL_04574 [Trypanosoma vivax]KAH8611696.1 putative Serine aminopeptidase S33 putatively [Trypanosoma vivax]CCC52904.1 conserved hypothetical protein [Trypanosoma vivax Y486]